ncbi:carbohydrate kinase family protein [Paenibacillus sp. URB8-2]|uniref:carbohydrate kinase family protein n=1 Tax=Paenibacillus sp. URB8-2 TaxID=2741301 RepID=UPI0015B94CC4|nr:carbohydrate kinase [Paenibacillus sp. URB8-2]BCG57005.1 putative sugar kinase YdjE [Paenibacillus sp. URB8-2]
MKNYGTVLCVGELLIDFFCTDVDVNLVDGQHFSKQAGGAPANVSAAIAKLGGNASFLGKVGDDPFGKFLKQTLDQERVDTSMLLFEQGTPTTLAFVSLQGNGERDFVFNRGADRLVTPEDLDKEQIKQAAIVHFGSATALLNDPFRQTYLELMDEAKDNGQFISFDPNYRGDLWKGREEEFISLSKEGIQKADFVKLSEDELKIVSGESDRKSALDILHGWGAKTVAVTLGKEGTLISTGATRTLIDSIKVKSIDSTGAGDAFIGAVLFQISGLEQPKEFAQDFEQLQSFVTLANRVGAIVCTKVGAIAALPTLEEVNRFASQADSTIEV